MQSDRTESQRTCVQHLPPELLSLIFAHLPDDQTLLPARVAQAWYRVCRQKSPLQTLYLRGSTYTEFGQLVPQSDGTFKRAVVALNCLGFCTPQQSALDMLLPIVQRGLHHLPNVEHLHLRYCLTPETGDDTAPMPTPLAWTGSSQLTSMTLTTVTFEHLLHFFNLLTGTAGLRHLALTDIWWPEYVRPPSPPDIFKNNRPPGLASLNVAISYKHVHEDLAAWFGSIPRGAPASLAIQYSQHPPLSDHQLAGFHPETLRFLCLAFKTTHFIPRGLGVLNSLEIISFAQNRFTSPRELRHAQTLVATVRSNTAWSAILNIDILPYSAYFNIAQFVQGLSSTPGLYRVFYIAPAFLPHAHAIFEAVSNLALFFPMSREQYTKLLAHRGITPHSPQSMPDIDSFLSPSTSSQ